MGDVVLADGARRSRAVGARVTLRPHRRQLPSRRSSGHAKTSNPNVLRSSSAQRRYGLRRGTSAPSSMHGADAGGAGFGARRPDKPSPFLQRQRTFGPPSAFIADHCANNDFELFRVLNVTAADQTPSLVRGVVASGDLFDLDWRPLTLEQLPETLHANAAPGLFRSHHARPRRGLHELRRQPTPKG